MRTQYLTLKMEQKCTQNQRQQVILKGKMQHCSSIMNHLRDEFPPILDSIEKIINQMIHQLQETWSEKLIREMRSLVSRLQHIQFQNTNPKYFPPESKYEEFGHHLRRVVQDFSKETLNPDDEVMVKVRAPQTVYHRSSENLVRYFGRIGSGTWNPDKVER